MDGRKTKRGKPAKAVESKWPATVIVYQRQGSNYTRVVFSVKDLVEEDVADGQEVGLYILSDIRKVRIIEAYAGGARG